jgi:metal-responsive CopG/Arc/MetJ family transcriptional regulator
MASQVTVRLPEDLMESLDTASKKMNLKTSEIVRMALREFLRVPSRSGQRAADRVRGLVGSLETGVPDLAEKHRSYILESLKHGG